MTFEACEYWIDKWRKDLLLCEASIVAEYSIQHVAIYRFIFGNVRSKKSGCRKSVQNGCEYVTSSEQFQFIRRSRQMMKEHFHLCVKVRRRVCNIYFNMKDRRKEIQRNSFWFWFWIREFAESETRVIVLLLYYCRCYSLKLNH